MKVLILNGSPKPNGNTAIALKEMEAIFEQQGIETEFITVGNKAIRGCIACGSCAEKGKCVFDDIVNEIAVKFEKADGLVVGSPVYYGSANATIVALLDVCAGTQDGDYSVQWKNSFLWRLAGVIASFGGVWAVVMMHVGALESWRAPCPAERLSFPV